MQEDNQDGCRILTTFTTYQTRLACSRPDSPNSPSSPSSQACLAAKPISQRSSPCGQTHFAAKLALRPSFAAQARLAAKLVSLPKKRSRQCQREFLPEMFHVKHLLSLFPRAALATPTRRNGEEYARMLADAGVLWIMEGERKNGRRLDFSFLLRAKGSCRECCENLCARLGLRLFERGLMQEGVAESAAESG